MSQMGFDQAGQGEVECASLAVLVMRVVMDDGVPECASRAVDRLERVTRDLRERGRREN